MDGNRFGAIADASNLCVAECPRLHRPVDRNRKNGVGRRCAQAEWPKLDIELPKKQLIVFTGVSGSGKSSLAFDTIFAEGQRRYVESLSTYARQFIGQMDKPRYDMIRGLSPTISIDQKAAAIRVPGWARSPRSPTTSACSTRASGNSSAWTVAIPADPV